MKTYISLIMGFTISMACAQRSTQTIYCNDYQNVALIMSEPISQAITGSDDFVFSYNPGATDSLGLLQGKPGKDSNLLIRTADGGIYHLLVKYKDSLVNFIYFIQQETSFNRFSKDSIATDSKRTSRLNNNSINEIRSIEKISNHYLKRAPTLLASNRNNKIILELQGIHYYKECVYMVLEIRNLSKIDFEIGSLDVAKIHGINNRRSSYQKIFLQRIGKNNLPKLIPGGSQDRFVLVYPKFTIGNHEKINFTLSEINGSRFVELTFDRKHHRIVN